MIGFTRLCEKGIKGFGFDEFVFLNLNEKTKFSIKYIKFMRGEIIRVVLSIFSILKSPFWGVSNYEYNPQP